MHTAPVKVEGAALFRRQVQSSGN